MSINDSSYTLVESQLLSPSTSAEEPVLIQNSDILSPSPTSRNNSHRVASGEVVLVTGPRCQQGDGDEGDLVSDVQVVESESCRTISFSGTPPAVSERKTDTRQEICTSRSGITSASCRFDDSWQRCESFFGAPAAQNEDLELQTPKSALSSPSTLDAPKEHGYKYEYTSDNDEEDSDDEDNEALQNATPSQAAGKSQKEPPSTYLLGKSYHPVHDFALRRTDESSLFWFTYRCDFPEIVPYRITTDAGWGCMLRSAQMLLAQTLRVHFRSRSWRPPASLSSCRQDPLLRSLFTWFADYSSKDNVFSLHNMVAAGMAKYETLPGEWYGPGTACHVVRDLCHLLGEQSGDGEKPMFRVHVASQGSVYRDAVEELMTSTTETESEYAKQSQEQRQEVPSHPLEEVHPLGVPSSSNVKDHKQQRPDWDTALLLLIPLRLGLKNFQDEYSLSLAHCFQFPQSVGVLGGRPRGARWFYGATADGQSLLALDPHTIQLAPQRHPMRGTKHKYVVALTDEYLRSVHTTSPDTILIRRMDPSIALGFYCRDRSDWDALCASLEAWKESHPNLPELFGIADALPDYSANVSSAMQDMMLSDMVGDDSGVEDGGGDGVLSDEDEYVLL